MRKVFLVIFPVFFLWSCSMLNPEQMLRTPRHYQYSDLEELMVTDQYRLAPNDEISFNIFTNDGERLIDPTTMLMGQGFLNQQITYRIEHDGTIKLPVLGHIQIAGLTTREAETMLQESFSRYYNRPFVQLRVVNNRVIIFPGGRGGTSTVHYLENANTTLFEALAKSGGIADGRASRVKLIRGEPANPSIYLINLSTIDGVKNANIVLQANDIIYVEPRERVPQRILENVTPYLSVLTTALLIYSLFTN